MERWNPGVKCGEREAWLPQVAGKSRELFVFPREHRHEIFDETFQSELETMYRDSGQGEEPQPPALMCMGPDFAWVGEEYGVLVEAKFSLKPNTSRNLADVSAIVETWERAAEPLAQAGEFLARGLLCLKGKLPTPKRWVLVVAANEPFIEEGLGFKIVAKAGGLLSGTGLDGIAMFTPTDLESLGPGGHPGRTWRAGAPRLRAARPDRHRAAARLRQARMRWAADAAAPRPCMGRAVPGRSGAGVRGTLNRRA